MKETLKSKKGITLIALIITIIVLIILAGISIAVLTGEDGLITKTKAARQNMENATIEEQTKLNTLYAEMDLQLTTGSANNSGTPVNQGGTSLATNESAGLSEEEHNMIQALYNKREGIPNLNSINPTKQINNVGWYNYFPYGSYSSPYTSISSVLPTRGYSHCSIYINYSSYNVFNVYLRTVDENGNVIGTPKYLNSNDYFQKWFEVDISDPNCWGISLIAAYHTSGVLSYNYSLEV